MSSQYMGVPEKLSWADEEQPIGRRSVLKPFSGGWIASNNGWIPLHDESLVGPSLVDCDERPSAVFALSPETGKLVGTTVDPQSAPFTVDTENPSAHGPRTRKQWNDDDVVASMLSVSSTSPICFSQSSSSGSWTVGPASLEATSSLFTTSSDRGGRVSRNSAPEINSRDQAVIARLKNHLATREVQQQRRARISSPGDQVPVFVFDEEDVVMDDGVQ
jgi:hypothetical protein